MQQQCLFCSHYVELVHVHGHYQCPVCNTNALPCCDGDNCETNKLPGVTNTVKPAEEESNGLGRSIEIKN